MKFVFAIGNPGLCYKNTYHSLGLLLSDALLKKCGYIQKKETNRYVFYKTPNNVNIIQSKVFMNVSFDALRELYMFFKFKPEDLLVLHDELSIKKFTFKLKTTEGLGGHNGLRDIANNIGKKFAKLQIGIDHPKNFNPNLDVSSYVLSKLNISEWEPYFEDGIKEILNWCF
ncbi:aminoacyl-tRNA hydrolase [Alphaproteobacteria bacterium endosymbiont of Tiliacea citrago]|uniref:aminoacyl-tRNA hydrolase n=1 Tax=Alphaproteobacteria bacterium endosymbiont of Tiliacea citrago TaxID=3077944 RepID=UPI00313B5EC6